MKHHEMLMLLNYHKAMSDENRLKIMAMLGQKQYNVSQLAGELELSEPTVSHHLSKLRSAGLVNMRSQGNQRFYFLSRGRLTFMNSLTQRLEAEGLEPPEPEPDDSWIDDLDMEEWEKKVMYDYFENGRLKFIPTKELKLIVVLGFLSQQFEENRDYTEREVNEVLSRYHEDFARLRRELVDGHYLGRERGGSRYWRVSEAEAEDV